MSPRWDVRFAPEAQQEKYKIPRGEAANFRDAIAILYEGPEPEGHEPLIGQETLFQYERNGYRIWCEVIPEARTVRVLFFEPSPEA